MSPTDADTRFVDLDGQPFLVHHWGDPANPPLLMLHGFPEYGAAWADLASHLCDRFYCVAPDQRGYGRSYAPEGVENYKGSALVGDMKALIDLLGGRATVLGHDWGAAVAYGLAIFAPEKVDRLIVLNGVHPVCGLRAMAAGGEQSRASAYIEYLRRPDSHQLLAADDYGKMIEFFQARMALDWLDGDRLNAYLREWSRPGRLDTMINWYRASPLRVASPGQPITDLPEVPPGAMRVLCPHLLIWGQQDRALLPESTAGLEDFAQDLNRVDIPGADHWLCHQKPAEIAEILRDWAESRPLRP
ncbi:MAG: alpha/beta hydrolase [Rhodobacteraceae bacterium]|nr:alpha/beta hydrolase [Paracoccaceae bacterium]